MDMSPFANNNQQQPVATPDYLRQSKGGGAPGVVSNMVKAIMDGNNKFSQRGGMAGMAPGVMGTPGGAIPGAAGPTSFGGSAGPMPLAPMAPSSTAPVTGGAGPMAPAPSAPAPMPPQSSSGDMASPFQNGAPGVPYASAPGIMSGGAGGGFPGMPNGPDRSMMGLFSRIPGGMYGG